MTSRRLYFGKLSEQVRERDLDKFVRSYGKVKEISIKRGYGFVEFYDERDAQDVVYELNGRELFGERVIIEHAREPSRKMEFGYSNRDRGRDDRRRRSMPVRTDYRLAVENLSSRINWQELKEIFNRVAEVTFTDAHKRKTGIGIVEFISKDDMKIALRKMDGADLNGKRIRVTVESVRSRSRSRSRSRGRRSKSRSPRRHHHRSRSRSPRRSRSTSKSRRDKHHSRSRSKSQEQKSRSPSPEKDGDESVHESGNESPNRNGEEDQAPNEDDE